MTNASQSKESERKDFQYLSDIENAINEIETHPKYRDGKSAWDEDKYYRGWCYLQLARIGEAASRLSKSENSALQESDSGIPLKKIKAMRNILVHVYWGIDDEIGWSAIIQLPELKEKVCQWIESNQPIEVTNVNRRSLLKEKLEEKKKDGS